MQPPFLIVFPFFISVFIVRVLPRIILAPVALLLLVILNRWFEPIVDELSQVSGEAYEPYSPKVSL
jgi:hypothetical protein